MGTWVNNPKIKLTWCPDTATSADAATSVGAGAGGYAEIFIGLYIRDSRLKLGFDFFKVLALVIY